MNLFNAKIITKLVASILMAVSLGTLVACASKPNQESVSEYVEDSVITTRVKAAIVNEPDLKVLEINVETFKGVVQLSGFVSEPSDINKATAVARNVKGVKSVKNDIRVK
jgi:hyperosmotically inducible protein